jgi:hypothetical protein
MNEANSDKPSLINLDHLTKKEKMELANHLLDYKNSKNFNLFKLDILDKKTRIYEPTELIDN